MVLKRLVILKFPLQNLAQSQQLHLYLQVKANIYTQRLKEIEHLWNNIIEAVEEKLDVDRTRGGNAIDTQIVSIETDDGSIDPVGGVIITVRIEYQFTRGTT